jgi:ceramide glucosyltransferase
MFSFVVSICLAISAAALLLHGLGAWATLKHMAPKHGVPLPLPALTLLKPIKGLEEELEQNLRSFFAQDYPAPLQFVFASTEASDPGIELARAVAAEYPRWNVSFVVSDPEFGYNPKVSNLAGALSCAVHELVLQSDANVRIRPGYLKAVVQEYLQERASLLGCLVVGSRERSLGAALENVQLSTFITPGICLAYEVFKIPCVIGKSILFRKSELAELGGLATVKDVLAEDYLLGELYTRAGKRVVLSRLVVDNINVSASLSRFVARHSRWLKMRVVVHVVGFVADLLSNASFFALLAALLSGGESKLFLTYVAVVAYKACVDMRLLQQLRGAKLTGKHVLCLPLRDLILPALWAHALFSRTTEWRGERFHLTRGSRLIPLGSSQLPYAALSALGPSSSPTPARPPAEHQG